MSLKEISAKRRGCLGAVTKSVRGIRALMDRPVLAVGDEMDKRVSKLLDVKGKFDESHEAVMDNAEASEQLKEECRKSADKAGVSVVSVLDDYEAWKVHGPVDLSDSDDVSVRDKAESSKAPAEGTEVQTATLMMLQKLHQALEGIQTNSVNVAVQNALEEQHRTHALEKQRMAAEMEEMRKKLDKLKLVSEIAEGDIGAYKAAFSLEQGATRKVQAEVNHVGGVETEADGNCIRASTYFTLNASSLPILRVKVRHGTEVCYVNALVDTGSTVTLCRESLAKRLNAPLSPVGRLSMNTVTSKEQIEVKLFSLNIGEPNSNAILPLYNVMAVPRFPLSPEAVPMGDSIEKWDHLSRLNIPIPEPGAVDLLIGQNNAHLMEPGDVVKGTAQEPYAVETPLGWMLYGNLDCDLDVEAEFGEHDCYTTSAALNPGSVFADMPPTETVAMKESDGLREFRESESILNDLYDDAGHIESLSSELEGDCCAGVGGIEDGPIEELSEIREQIERMAMIDEVPDLDLLSAEDRYVLDLWEREFCIVDEHVVLPIPFKTDPPQLVNNFSSAYRALRQLGRRLLADPVMHRQYKEAVLEYFALGYAEIIEDEQAAVRQFVWYLIHHGVQHPRKPNVTRVVKNGAAEFRGCSLNKAAYKGPDLMNRLVEVLTRFRQLEVGTTGDIKGMFNQVLVPENQRDYERFLFWEDGDPTKKVIICRMKTHVFGSVWSPAAANFALKKLALIHAANKPKIARSILKEFYVDDWMNSEENSKRSHRMLMGVQNTIAHGSFDLGKIASSSREVLLQVPAEKRAKELATIDVAADKLPRNVMLGQHWEPNRDSLVFELLLEPKPFTKRGMTSCVSSIFDPLGLLSPFILPAKLLMQMGSRSRQEWDEALDEVTLGQWSEWLQEIPQIEKFRLNRWFGCSSDTKQILHLFGDASERSYAAASFLVVERASGSVSTLVASKSRVAPSKRLTIPKLEMAGAVLAVKLGRMVERMFSVVITAVYYWVDSTIVLVLIHKDPGELKTFMGNRVAYIQKHTDLAQWGHVPSEMNPADIASRGMKMSELVECKMWHQGPEFVLKPQEAWPAKTVKIQAADGLSEELKKRMSVFCVDVVTVAQVGELFFTDEDVIELRDMDLAGASVMAIDSLKGDSRVEERGTLGIITGRYSNWEKTLRMAAYIARFAKYWAAGVRKDMVTKKEVLGLGLEVGVNEMVKIELQVICWEQKLSFTREDQQEAQWKSLLPYQDETRLWRIGGRNMYAEMPSDVKFPIILPRSGEVTEMLVRKAHQSAGHGGTDRTLMDLRARFWILGGRVSVKRIIGACITCKKVKARPGEQMMAPLPSERLVAGKPVFWNSGVDLFGPISVVLKRSTVKRYGALFTCFSTRAVHLEPVEDLSASAFLDTLERFTCRRGTPDAMKSDNGTNFVYTSKMIPEVEEMTSSKEFRNGLVRRRLKWSFNSPAASHQGGVWERLIRSVRELLLFLLNKEKVTDSRFHTVLCMAEAVMNSRPLTRLTEDPASLDALTPAHFIHLRAFRPVFGEKFSNEQLRKDWTLRQAIASEFWDQWMGIYVPSLQRRAKWLRERGNVRPGELVLVVNDQYARCDWPLGVITETHPGKDGLVRNVTLRTAQGHLKRPIQKVVRLELDVT